MFGTRTDLRGARALVTGATSGIGHALARRLTEQGARVVVTGRRTDRLDALVNLIRQRGGEAHAIPADVTDPAQRAHLVDSTLAQLGGMDLLVNNAGAGAMGPFVEATEERLRRVFEINFFSATELTRLALPHLFRGKNPQIVNVASVLGRRAMPGCSEYCASKFAMVGWSEGLRAELAKDGVHVLVVCPGSIDTEFRANLLEDRATYRWQARGMSADRCAWLIVRAIQTRRNEVTITAGGKLLVGLNRAAPWLVDRLMEWFARPRGGDGSLSRK